MAANRGVLKPQNGPIRSGIDYRTAACTKRAGGRSNKLRVAEQVLTGTCRLRCKRRARHDFWPHARCVIRSDVSPVKTPPVRVVTSGRKMLCSRHTARLEAMMLFASVLAGWYGPSWRQTAPRALGRSRRTIARWAADDSRVPRWVWLRFSDEERATARWRSIDAHEVDEHAQLAAAARDQKSAVALARRLAERRLAEMQFEPERRRGRPRIHPRALRNRTAAPPLLRDRASHERQA